mgnify:CR=1 FL=1
MEDVELSFAGDTTDGDEIGLRGFKLVLMVDMLEIEFVVEFGKLVNTIISSRCEWDRLYVESSRST